MKKKVFCLVVALVALVAVGFAWAGGEEAGKISAAEASLEETARIGFPSRSCQACLEECQFPVFVQCFQACVATGECP